MVVVCKYSLFTFADDLKVESSRSACDRLYKVSASINFHGVPLFPEMCVCFFFHIQYARACILSFPLFVCVEVRVSMYVCVEC